MREPWGSLPRDRSRAIDASLAKLSLLTSSTSLVKLRISAIRAAQDVSNTRQRTGGARTVAPPQLAAAHLRKPPRLLRQPTCRPHPRQRSQSSAGSAVCGLRLQGRDVQFESAEFGVPSPLKCLPLCPQPTLTMLTPVPSNFRAPLPAARSMAWGRRRGRSPQARQVIQPGRPRDFDAHHGIDPARGEKGATERSDGQILEADPPGGRC